MTRSPLSTVSLVVLAALSLTACSTDRKPSAAPPASPAAKAPAGKDPAAANAATAPRLFEGTGPHHRAISTSVPEAQRWFDQGLAFLQAFNHDEAVRSFTQVNVLDPQCPMGHWGVALALGTHINNPVLPPEREQAAYEAEQRALALVGHANPTERALIEALQHRYSSPPAAERAPRDKMYAEAMAAVWAAHPNDADVGALYAEALMDLQPWDLWTDAGAPKGNTTRILEVLEAVQTLEPDHPGALHLYIHAGAAWLGPHAPHAQPHRRAARPLGAGHRLQPALDRVGHGLPRGAARAGLPPRLHVAQPPDAGLRRDDGRPQPARHRDRGRHPAERARQLRAHEHGLHRALPAHPLRHARALRPLGRGARPAAAARLPADQDRDVALRARLRVRGQGPGRRGRGRGGQAARGDGEGARGALHGHQPRAQRARHRRPRPRGRDRLPQGRARRGHRRAPAGHRPRGQAGLHGAARVDAARAPLARRDPAAGGPRGGGRDRVPRGPGPVARQRLVAVRTGRVHQAARRLGGGDRAGRVALPRGLGRRRHPDRGELPLRGEADGPLSGAPGDATAGGAADQADEGRRLEAWRRLEGLPESFVLAVHPRDEMLPGTSEPTTVPPGRERLVYLRTGLETVTVLEHALAAFGRTLAAPARVLEVACGYGRVTRHLQQRVDAGRLVTCEIVPAAVEHVAATFGVPCLPSQADPAAIRWPGRFDTILVSSLFSHLPRPRFEAWLAALRGALADDGLLVVSTHGLWMPQAPPHDGRGFAFHPESESLTLAGAEYGTTFVAPQEAARMARAAGYADVRWLERELWALQDVLVASPAPLREARPWRPAPVLDGAITGCGGAPGELRLQGFVECRDPDRRIERATLRLDAGPALELELLAPRREDAPPPRPSRRVVADWQVHERLPAGLDGRHTLALVAEAAGQRHVADVRTLDLDGPRLSG